MAIAEREPIIGLHSAVGYVIFVVEYFTKNTNMPVSILLKDFLHFKKMPRHKYFRHLIIHGGPKMHLYFLAQ